jgi:hypothetical protein
VLSSSGIANHKTIFFIRESQSFEEVMMENISQILNNGDYSDLFAKEDASSKFFSETEKKSKTNLLNNDHAEQPL